jgi:hypothetical protein
MWITNPPLKLLRYLFVLQVNSSLVRLMRCPTREFSLILGARIVNRLPTSEARAWRKVLASWQGQQAAILAADEEAPLAVETTPVNPTTPTELSWPLQTVLHLYPGKLNYGRGERLLLEVKLVGDSANHQNFLELILPALEEAGWTHDPIGSRPTALWGHYDIAGVYVARGLRWEPLVRNGQIDLNAQPTPGQWAAQLPFVFPRQHAPNKLMWITPYAFDGGTHPPATPTTTQRPAQKLSKLTPPSLVQLLESIAPHWAGSPPVWRSKMVKGEETLWSWDELLQQAQSVRTVHSDLHPAPRDCPGEASGLQTFSNIPHTLVPYLVLASLLHVGRYTHLGCGAFYLF